MTTTETTVATPAANGNGFKMDAVIDAMRELHDEHDRWYLSEVLFEQIPAGLAGFSQILDKAKTEGVAGSLSVNTLRLYRDTASRWPADKRVKGITFSAHREAMNLGDVTAANKMLRDLARQGGTGNVTVKRVREAVAVAQNKPVRQPSTTANAKTKALDVLNDLEAGAPLLIAAIGPATDDAALDKLHQGLTKAIAHVERLRAKAARKAAAAKKPAPATAKATAAKKAASSTKKGAGDLRGL
jgi:hypothetical protein